MPPDDLRSPCCKPRERLTNLMSRLTIVGYDDPYQAEEVRLKLLKLQREYVMALKDAVVAVKDEQGKVKLHQSVDFNAGGTFDIGGLRIEASRLLGATVIVTGLSPEIAQTLVKIGVDLGKMNTVGDLQGGIEEAERLLGYKVVPFEAPAQISGLRDETS